MERDVVFQTIEALIDKQYDCEIMINSLQNETEELRSKLVSGRPHRDLFLRHSSPLHVCRKSCTLP